MAVCLIPLLPPVQNAIFSIIGERFTGTGDPRYMSGVDGYGAKLAPFLSLAFVGFVVFLYGFCCLFSKKIATFLEDAKNNSIAVALLAFLTIVILIFASVFAYNHGWQWLDSDAASEMILGQFLAKENTFVSGNWSYSTEIRLVYQTLFTMPLFKLLGGLENWALIRAINIFLNNIVLLLSYFFLAKQLKVQAKWILLSGLFLIVPLSGNYWEIITFGGYYTFFIAQFFCLMGLFIKLVDNADFPRKPLVLLVLFSILSFVLGLQGIRSLLVIHIPLLVSGIWLYLRVSKKKFPLFLSAYGFVIGCVGYMGNFILHFWYSFQSFRDASFENLQASFFEKLGAILVCIIEFFGFHAGSPFLSAGGVFSLLSIITTAIFFYVIFTLPNKTFLSTIFLVASFVNIFVFIFTKTLVMNRYFLPFMVLYIPLVAVFFERSHKMYGHLKQVAFVFGISLFVFGQGYLNFQNWSAHNVNSNRKGYIQYLLDNRLNFGFATLLNANVNTELTDGKIVVSGLDTAALNHDPATSIPLQVQPWLNPIVYNQASFYENKEGESFLLLAIDEWKVAKSTNREFAFTEPDFQDNYFAIWRFPSAYTIFSEVLDTK